MTARLVEIGQVELIQLDWQPPPPQHALYQETNPSADYYDGPGWCLCGVVDDKGDGTCRNCGLRIMTDDDELVSRPEQKEEV